MAMTAHGYQGDPLLFGNSENLPRRLPEFQSPTASDPGRLHLLSKLAQPFFSVPLPGTHALEAVRGETDLLAYFDDIQEDEFLRPKPFPFGERKGEVARLLGQVRRHENSAEDTALLVPLRFHL